MTASSDLQAPEILKAEDPADQPEYDSRSDMWSFGCLMWEVLTMAKFKDPYHGLRFPAPPSRLPQLHLQIKAV